MTRWRVCIDYRKLNIADHYSLPFIDQMLDMLAKHPHYYFIDGYSRYNLISIAPKDQKKTTFTCPYATFSFGRMLVGLYNALATFQRCMMSMFSDLVEKVMEIFMDDFSLYGSSFEFRKFGNSTSKVSRQKSSSELGKIPFYGNRWYCLGAPDFYSWIRSLLRKGYYHKKSHATYNS